MTNLAARDKDRTNLWWLLRFNAGDVVHCLFLCLSNPNDKCAFVFVYVINFLQLICNNR